MRSSLRMTATVIALAAIAFFAYTRSHHHLVTNTGGDLPIGVLVAKTLIHKGTAGNLIAAGKLFSVKTIRSRDVPKGAQASSPSVGHSRSSGGCPRRPIRR
jgi:hypothetical protein